MIKTLIVLSTFLVAISCNTSSADSYDKMVMQERITALEKRVDSLINVIAAADYKPEKQTTAKNKKSKKNRPIVEDNMLPLSQPLPPPRPIQTTTKQSVSEQTSYSSQCSATTKKGARCKRTSRSNGYCWQHGG